MNKSLRLSNEDSSNAPVPNYSVGTVRVLVLIVGLMLFLSSSLFAQIQGLKNGDRVRLYAPSVDRSRLFGTVSELSPSALVLLTRDSTFTIPYVSIQQLGRASGKETKILKGAFLGMAVGGLTGGLIGASTYRGCGSNCAFAGFEQFEVMLKGYLIGSVSGLVFGAVIGAKKRDRWESMPVQVSMAPGLSRSKEISMNPTVTFRMSLGGGNR